jgi:ABC-type multidrug transport system fused ATPase/permease subunit
LLLQATGSRIGAILQATSTLAIGVILSFTFSWKMTLVSLIPIPLIFLGVFVESRVIRGHGLKEKSALEAATKVSHDKSLFNVYHLFIL